MSGGLDFDLSEVKMSFRKRHASKVDNEERISVADSFVSLLSSALGAGVLSIPLSFAYSGLIQATIILALVGFITYHSNYALLKVAQKVNGKSYADVAEKALGKSKASFAIVLLFFLNLLAASVSYLIAIHWALSSTINYLSVNFHYDVPAFLGKIISCERLNILGFDHKHRNYAVHLLPKAEAFQLFEPNFLHYCAFGHCSDLYCSADSTRWSL